MTSCQKLLQLWWQFLGETPIYNVSANQSKRLQSSINPVMHAIYGALGGRISVEERTMVIELATKQKCVGNFPDVQCEKWL